MEKAFRVYLTLITLSVALVVFLTSQKITFIDKLHPIFANVYPLASFLSYLLAAIWLAKLGLFVIGRYLGNDCIKEKTLVSIEPAGDTYLPVYLGYFFVALSLSSFELFLYVFGLIGIFIFSSRSVYFNPLFYLLGFYFYHAQTQKGRKILIVTRDCLFNPQTVSFPKIKRVNDYTFIDIGDSL